MSSGHGSARRVANYGERGGGRQGPRSMSRFSSMPNERGMGQGRYWVPAGHSQDYYTDARSITTSVSSPWCATSSRGESAARPRAVT